jgi:hypothetical protein
MVVSGRLNRYIPRPNSGTERKAVLRKVLYHTIVVRFTGLSYGICIVEHRLLGRRLTPARTAALLEVIAIVRSDLPAKKTELCKTHANDVIAAVFECEDVAAAWADLEIFAANLILGSCGYFLWIDSRFTPDRSLLDAVEEVGREDRCEVL